jgi:hypothetical protein
MMTANGMPASVKEIFERYGLLGTWSADCSKPLGKQNRYAIYRAIDADHVQREVKSDPAVPGRLSIADRASEAGPNEVIISWVDENSRTINTVRVEGNRFRLWQSASDTGEQFVVDGREVDDGEETVWIHKCGA